MLIAFDGRLNECGPDVSESRAPSCCIDEEILRSINLQHWLWNYLFSLEIGYELHCLYAGG